MNDRRSSTSTPQGSRTKSNFQKLGEWMCTKCETPCEDPNDIECFICKQWTHQDCAQMKDKDYPTLSRPNIQYICNPCIDSGKIAADAQSQQDVRIDKLLDLVTKLTAKVADLERGLGGENIQAMVKKMVDEKVEEMMEEKEEIEKRKLNIILVGVPESRHEDAEERKKKDLDAAREILGQLTDMEDDEVKDPIRLGPVTVGKRPRMMRVTLSREERKQLILRKAPQLNQGKTDPKEKVYVNADYTPKQRQKRRELREELERRRAGGEQNLAIRNWAVVTVTPRTQTDTTTKRDTKDGREGEEKAKNK